MPAIVHLRTLTAPVPDAEAFLISLQSQRIDIG
jgi:hypothetical protein